MAALVHSNIYMAPAPESALQRALRTYIYAMIYMRKVYTMILTSMILRFDRWTRPPEDHQYTHALRHAKSDGLAKRMAGRFL